MQIRTWSFGVIGKLLVVGALSAVAIFASGFSCNLNEPHPTLCATTQELSDSAFNTIKDTGTCPAGDEVWICPQETVYLYISVPRDFTSASIDNGVGPVTIPYSIRSVHPKEDTTYTIRATGGGNDASMFAQVWVVTPGKTRELHVTLPELSAKGPPPLKASVEVPVETTSLNIRVTSIKTKTPAVWASWQCSKTDLDGTVHSADVGPDAGPLPDGSFPLVGSWEFRPAIPAGTYAPNSLYGSGQTFVVTLTCG